MRYEHDRREEWLAWFLDPQTQDPDELRAALESVPEGLEPWLFVETRLRVALDEAKRQGRIKPGHTVLLNSFGGGFSWGAAVIKF